MAGVPGPLTFRRSPAVVALSLCGGLLARCLCVGVFCSCAGLNLNCYELRPVVNRLKHSGCAKNPDQSGEHMLTNVAGMILYQENWRAGPDADRKIELDPRCRSNSMYARTRRTSAGKPGRKNSAGRSWAVVRNPESKSCATLIARPERNRRRH